ANAKDAPLSLHADADGRSRVVARLQAGGLGTVKRCTGAWGRVAGEGYDGWIPQDRLWGGYPNEKIEERRLLLWHYLFRKPVPTFRDHALTLLAAQAHHYIDAGNLVAIGRGRQFVDQHLGARNIDERVFSLDEEVMVLRSVGVEVALRTIDRDLAQQTDL